MVQTSVVPDCSASYSVSKPIKNELCTPFIVYIYKGAIEEKSHIRKQKYLLLQAVTRSCQFVFTIDTTEHNKQWLIVYIKKQQIVNLQFTSGNPQ
jgi:hypothetical protein